MTGRPWVENVAMGSSVFGVTGRGVFKALTSIEKAVSSASQESLHGWNFAGLLVEGVNVPDSFWCLELSGRMASGFGELGGVATRRLAVAAAGCLPPPFWRGLFLTSCKNPYNFLCG